MHTDDCGPASTVDRDDTLYHILSEVWMLDKSLPRLLPLDAKLRELVCLSAQIYPTA